VRSEHLTYRPVEPSDLDAFSSLVQDAHVRRYMMDGQVFPPAWSAARIRESEALFDRLGVGLWLAHEQATGDLVGFCGYLVLPEVHATPELVYALRAPFTGRGLAAEMARVCIFEAQWRKCFPDGIVASVNVVNAAAVRVLERLGFERVDTRPGAFGDMLLFRLTDDPSPPVPEPEPRYPTRAAIDALAKRFGLENSPGMQDWEWQVADPDRIDEFLAAYESGALTDDERFTLMETILQSFEELPHPVDEDPRLPRLLALLRHNLALHRHTIWQWSAYQVGDLDEDFQVSPYMRTLMARLS
jgi:RimJ/RimL family protein N-acetyltransferase